MVAAPALASIQRSSFGGDSVVYSRSQDRAAPRSLSEARLSGNVYVFTPGRDVARVAYFVDSAPSSNQPYSRATVRPFDLAGTTASGTPRPFDTATLGVGGHTIVAVITRRDGSSRVVSSRFIVREGASASWPRASSTREAAPGGPTASASASGSSSSSAATSPSYTVDPSTSASGDPAPPVTTAPVTTPPPTDNNPVGGIQVRGNQFVDGAGRPVRLTGFNFSGAEYSCVEDSTIFDTPAGTKVEDAVIHAMQSWQGANVVRLNLNEQCWLGIGGAKSGASGATYQAAIHDAVVRLNAAGFVVLLDLHRSAPGSATSLNQEPMPDRDHSVTFWTQVAQAYKNNHSVMFDLFNEPFPYGGVDTTQAWQCWRDGGCTQRSENGGSTFVVAGMSELIAAVRSTGARNVVLAGGLNYAEITSRWLEFKPADPTGNLAVSVHVYSFNDCSSTSCYQGDMSTVAGKVPMFVGEFGPDLTIKQGFDQNCPQSVIGNSGFSAALLNWMDSKGVSYAAWAFDTWGDCWALVKNWNGDPTPVWGAEIKARLAKSAAG